MLIGLVVIRFTELSILDPIITLAVALLILKTGYNVTRKSFGELVGVRLPETEEVEIKSCIMEPFRDVREWTIAQFVLGHSSAVVSL